MALAGSTQPSYLRPGAGERLRVITDVVTIKMAAAATNDAFTLIETETPPGGGCPAHTQRYDDESFYVIEGRYAFLVGDERIELGPGGYVYVPRGTVHAFANAGPAPARMLVLVTPGGIHERFLAEVGERATRAPWEPDMAHLLAVAPKYGVAFLQDEADSAAP